MLGGIGFLFFILIAYLFFLAGFSTSYVDKMERIYLTWDSIGRNMLTLTLVTVCGGGIAGRTRLVRRLISKIRNEAGYADRLARIILTVLAVLAFLFLMLTQEHATADQRDVCEAANALMDRNYTIFAPGRYMNMYPNQVGIVLFIYLLSHVFGSFNYLAFQFCNVAALLWMYKALSEAAVYSDKGHDRQILRLLILCAGVLFLPLTLYCSFVYGTVIGLALSVNALYSLVRFSDRGHFRDGCRTVVYILGAVIVKQNYLIFLIGLILTAVLWAFRDRQWRLWIMGGLLAAVLLLNGQLTRGTMYLITGVHPGTGVTGWAWIAMGIQDNDKRYDGWYNSYNRDTYLDNNYDTEAQELEAKACIRERIAEFKENPLYTVRFFAGKNASQWNNPDFQSIWIQQAASCSVTPPGLINRAFSPEGAWKIGRILNRLQFVILGGTLAFVLFLRKRNMVSVFCEMTIIGGFIFHTFWEAKGQYTLPYYVLILPFAAEGLLYLWRSFAKLPGKIRRFSAGKAEAAVAGRRMRRFILPACLLLLLLWIRFVPTPLADALIRRYDDSAAFTQYLLDNTWMRVKGGKYRISAGESSLELCTGDAYDANPDAGTLQISEPDPEERDRCIELFFSKQDSYFFMRFLPDGKNLDVPKGKAEEGTQPVAFLPNHREPQRLWLHKSGREGMVNILYDKTWALTYDRKDGNVYLRAFTDAEDQQWRLTEVRQEEK